MFCDCGNDESGAEGRPVESRARFSMMSRSDFDIVLKKSSSKSSTSIDACFEEPLAGFAAFDLCAADAAGPLLLDAFFIISSNAFFAVECLTSSTLGAPTFPPVGSTSGVTLAEGRSTVLTYRTSSSMVRSRSKGTSRSASSDKRSSDSLVR